MKQKLLLVPSTHWDREWYKTEAEFGVHLSELFEKVLSNLESGELENFYTDGQSVIVEDIIRLKPEWKERIARFAAAGKLEIGPSYALTDMFMPSGESFFRNFMYGVRIVRELGGVPGIPYAPDAFGHGPDIPAILRSNGFDSYFFCRGLGDQMEVPRSEFVWKDRFDRYQILAIAAVVDLFAEDGAWIAGAYGLGMNLPQEQQAFQKRMNLIVKSLREYSDSPVLLAINGCDHLLPEDNLAFRLKKFNESGADFSARTSTIAEYVAETWKSVDMEKVPRISGELLDGKFFAILTGTSSCRVNLKIRNARNQYFLEKIIEPAMASAPETLRELFQPYVDQAWQFLLQNQTHDSICGCSTDAVHREMVVRFERIEASMKAVAERLLRKKSGVEELRMIMPDPGTENIQISIQHNNSQTGNCALWNFSIVVPVNLNIEDYALFDNNGNEWDYIPVNEFPDSTTNGPFFPSGPEGRVCSKYRIYTTMPMPEGFSTQTAEFRKRKGEKNVCTGRELPVSEVNGKICLKMPDEQISDWLALEDVQDFGDEYVFSPAPDRKIYRNSGWKETGKTVTEHLYSATFETSLSVPEREESAEMTDLKVKFQVIGSFGDCGFVTRWDVKNTARDHNLKLKISSPFPFKEYCRQTQFQHLMTSSARKPEPENWRDKTEPLRRNFGFVTVSENGKCFSVMPEGLHEHCTDGKSFLFTMFRAVGRLGRNGGGPNIITEDAQMPGVQSCSIAFSWRGNPAGENTVHHQSLRLLQPGCGVILHPEFRVEKFEEQTLFLDSSELLISAFYYDTALQRNLLRIYNPVSHSGSGCLCGKNIPEEIFKVEYDRAVPVVTEERISVKKICLDAGEIATFAF